MKKFLTLSLAAAAICFSATAQTDRVVKPTDNTTPNAIAERRMGADAIEMMKDLNLSADQKVKVKAAMENMRTKTDAVRSNTTLTPEEKRTQLKALRDEQKTTIAGLLTPEQKMQLAANRKQAAAAQQKTPAMGTSDPKTVDKVTSMDPQ